MQERTINDDSTATNTTVTYLPMIYGKSVDEESGMQVETPNAPLGHFKKHVADMSAQGWALVSVESLPRIKHNEHTAFSEVVGYLLFWQRPVVLPPQQVQEQAVTDGSVTGQGHAGSDEAVADKPGAASPVMLAGSPGWQDTGQESSETRGGEQEQDTAQDDTAARPRGDGIDLNQKYRVSRVKPGTRSKEDYAKSPAPVTTLVHKKELPVAVSTGFSPGVSDDDVVSDFNPDDPLVQEVRSLRHALAHRDYIVDPSAKDNVQLDDPE